jgi:UDP-N-acetylglucosamine acyltransferase
VIHPTAIVHPAARLAPDVVIGPYTIVGEHVQIASGTQIGAHAVITGHTTIGRDNRIFHGACIGEIPQDKKYGGEPTRLEIGDRNTIREFCTINTGTVQEQMVTRVGDDNWIMAYAHIAHDNIVGNRTVIANSVQLAGHVTIEDCAILGGATLVHQFCRVGAHAFTAGGSVVLRDVPPYVMAGGNSAQPHGINSEGLKRRGFSPETIEIIRRAYKTLYRSGLSYDAAKEALAQSAAGVPELQLLVTFLAGSSRGIIR